MPTLDNLLAARRAALRSAEAVTAAHAGPAQITQAEVQASFTLPRQLTAATVLGTRDALQAWLAQRPAGQAWCLAAADVDEIDAAGLQLLLSLATTAAARYVCLRLIEPSAALAAACAALGLDGVLLPRETSAAAR